MKISSSSPGPQGVSSLPPVALPREAPKVAADGLERGGSAALHEGPERLPEGSPFAALVDAAAPAWSRPPLAEVVDLGHDLTMPLALTARIFGLAQKSGGDFAGTLARLHTAGLLLASDAPAPAVEVSPVVAKLVGGDGAGAAGELREVLSAAGSLALDVDALVQAVLREAYLEGTQRLRDFALKVDFYNRLKRSIREELAAARELMAKMAGAGEKDAIPTPFTRTQFASDWVGEGTAPVLARGEALAAASGDASAAAELSGCESPAAPVADTPDISVKRVKSQWSFAKDNVSHTVDHRRSYGGTDDRSVIVNHGQELVTEVQAYLGTLSEPERLRLEKYWSEHGLSVNATVEDKHGQNNDYRLGERADFSALPESGERRFVRKVIKRKDGESLETFIARALPAIMQEFSGQVGNAEGEISIHSIYAEVRIPDYEVTVDGKEVGNQAEYLAAIGQGGQGELASGAGGVSAEGGAMAASDSGEVRNKADLDAYIKALEERLNSAGDDSQLANVDLQNELQKQQQLIQMMSNISKMLHDTAMAVIRKIGG